MISSLTFFYPDYTVDPGVSPGHAFSMRVGYTTDRESEPAFLTLPRRLLFNCCLKYKHSNALCQMDCEIHRM